MSDAELSIKKEQSIPISITKSFSNFSQSLISSKGTHSKASIAYKRMDLQIITDLSDPDEDDVRLSIAISQGE